MSISFEGFERFSQETLDERVVAEAHKKAVERFEQDRIIIDPENFTDYSAESIRRDLKYVEEMESRFAESSTEETVEAKRLATILEEVFADQIELNNWLGPNVLTRKASKYDDIKNGVDEILEIHEDISINYLAIAIDVTYGKDSMRKKLQRIKEEISSGELTTVKYFESSDGSFRGRLSNLPRVIIGADKRTVFELAKLWIERDNKALAQHPVQLEILDEMKTQLEVYKSYAAQMGKDDIVKIYDRQIALVQKIRMMDDKKALRKIADLSYRQEDQVYLALKDNLKEQFHLEEQ